MVVIKRWDYGTGTLEILSCMATAEEADQTVGICLHEDHATDAVYWAEEVVDDDNAR